MFRRLARRWNGPLKAVLMPLRIFMPRHLGLAQVEAVLTARTAGWSAAAPLFRQIECQSRSQSSRLAQSLLAPPLTLEGFHLTPPVGEREIDLPLELARQIVVYTTRFARRPFLPPVLGQPEGLRFICFTDVPVTVPGWEIVIIPEPVGGDAFAAICPHLLLKDVAPDAAWSLYIDSDQIPVGNLHTLIMRWLMPQDIAVWRDPVASDWQARAERLLLTGLRSVTAVLAQVATCAAENLPRGRGISDTAMIWRHHADPAVTRQMDAWWALHRDNPDGDPGLSLDRLRHHGHDTQATLTVLPEALGTSETNIFFARNAPGLQAVRPRRPAPGLRQRKVPITFLYAAKWRETGVTMFRAIQLSRMVALAYPDLFDVTLTSEIDTVRDQVVIVNRGAIQFNPLDQLADLKAHNIASVSDWLDLPVRPKANPVFDAHMAMCLPQALALNRSYPGTPAFHVTHHVNPSVPHCSGPTDRLRTGYFGRPANTSRPGSLTGVIDVVEVVDAGFTAQDWARQAPLYNCHWIVRETDHLQQWKPFLKAFVAARCGAVVIVTRDDMNAMHYLGDDYPFYADSLAPSDLEMAWLKAASAFGGTDWTKAQAIMRQVKARSSDHQVMVEFKAMIDEILA
ncbi:hypothetical protein [Loktanella fryxellensis]|uniref:hypothetical protein n=1 Tax=Loktanella fryxellensis TaxID=245187 RepID=UPI00115F83BF|nr:hypothetical protein [Loktanella fryxellensis]